jgi:hypothetical protein
MIDMTKNFRNFFRVAYGVNCGRPQKKKTFPDLPLQKKPIGVARWLIRLTRTGFQSCVCGDTGGSQTRPCSTRCYLNVFQVPSVGFCGVVACSVAIHRVFHPVIPPAFNSVPIRWFNRAFKAPHAPHQHKPTQTVAIGRSICTKPILDPAKHPQNPPKHPPKPTKTPNFSTHRA